MVADVGVGEQLVVEGFDTLFLGLSDRDLGLCGIPSGKISIRVPDRLALRLADDIERPEVPKLVTPNPNRDNRSSLVSDSHHVSTVSSWLTPNSGKLG